MSDIPASRSTPARHTAPPATPSGPTDDAARGPDVLFAIGLFLLTFVAYGPALRAGFIWDDDDYVTQNRTLVDFDGLRRIWFDLGATPQYYPLVHSSFWLEYRLAGVEPWLYHATNVALHATAALLLWRALRRLSVPGAGLAAIVFALHPVHVESVAWVTERKNVLSAVCYLAAALAYLRFALNESGELAESSGLDESGAAPSRRRWVWYAAAAVLYVAALLSKTVTFSLPAALAVVLWWKRGRLAWRDLVPLAPLVALAILPVLATIRLEREHVGASGAEWSLDPIEKLLVAGRALWFYAGKLAWPADLTFIYPRWTIDSSAPWQYVFPVAALALFVLLWTGRERWGRGPLAAVLIFSGTLVPALGFFNVYPMRYSFVADHFQYLASVALIVLAAAAAALAGRRWLPGRETRVMTVAGAGLAVVLGTLTFRQCHAYRDLPTLWTDVLAKNPTCWMAHANLAGYLADHREFADAQRHYDESLRLNPANVEAVVGLATLHMNQRQYVQAESLLNQAIELDATLPITYFYYGLLHLRRQDFDAAIERLRQACELNPRFVSARYHLGLALLQTEQTDEAYAQLEQVVAADPRHAAAHEQLARRDMSRADWTAAQRHLEAAVESQPDSASAHQALGVVLQKRGLVGRASFHFQQARRLSRGAP